jgi:50S ribosomal protein L16 3-hydroxylase
MLKRWLSAESHQDFLHSRREARAFASPSIAAIEPALFDWSVLDRVLARASDVIVTRAGAMLELAAPRSAAAVRELFLAKAGVVIRHAQRHHDGLRALSDAYAREFDSEVHIQLFVTPGETHGFGWHYDPDDVVILQTAGRKNYYFRANTQVPAARLGAPPDFSLVRQETSPLLGCTLHRGDALYLPRGMWHMARAREDSLSISLGLVEAVG